MVLQTGYGLVYGLSEAEVIRHVPPLAIDVEPGALSAPLHPVDRVVERARSSCWTRCTRWVSSSSLTPESTPSWPEKAGYRPNHP